MPANSLLSGGATIVLPINFGARWSTIKRWTFWSASDSYATVDGRDRFDCA